MLLECVWEEGSCSVLHTECCRSVQHVRAPNCVCMSITGCPWSLLECVVQRCCNRVLQMNPVRCVCLQLQGRRDLRCRPGTAEAIKTITASCGVSECTIGLAIAIGCRDSRQRLWLHSGGCIQEQAVWHVMMCSSDCHTVQVCSCLNCAQ
jgi:hypothetical protein